MITESDAVFICVKPLDIYPLLKRLSPVFTHDHIVVTITSPVQVEQLEAICLLPSGKSDPEYYEQSAGRRVILDFRRKLRRAEQKQKSMAYAAYLYPLQIESGITRVASDIVSCGPAFVSYLVQGLLEQLFRRNISVKTGRYFNEKEMLVGLGRLLETDFTHCPPCRKRFALKAV